MIELFKAHGVTIDLLPDGRIDVRLDEANVQDLHIRSSSFDALFADHCQVGALFVTRCVTDALLVNDCLAGRVDTNGNVVIPRTP